jgi:hypothetical protein
MTKGPAAMPARQGAPMKIIPNRNMQLGGEHVERGQTADVSDADGELAIRHGWAVKARAPVAKAKAPENDQKAGE